MLVGTPTSGRFVCFRCPGAGALDEVNQVRILDRDRAVTKVEGTSRTLPLGVTGNTPDSGRTPDTTSETACVNVHEVGGPSLPTPSQAPSGEGVETGAGTT